jgi:hypothetical protein
MMTPQQRMEAARECQRFEAWAHDESAKHRRQHRDVFGPPFSFPYLGPQQRRLVFEGIVPPSRRFGILNSGQRTQKALTHSVYEHLKNREWHTTPTGRQGRAPTEMQVHEVIKTYWEVVMMEMYMNRKVNCPGGISLSCYRNAYPLMPTGVDDKVIRVSLSEKLDATLFY